MARFYKTTISFIVASLMMISYFAAGQSYQDQPRPNYPGVTSVLKKITIHNHFHFFRRVETPDSPQEYSLFNTEDIDLLDLDIFVVVVAPSICEEYYKDSVIESVYLDVIYLEELKYFKLMKVDELLGYTLFKTKISLDFRKNPYELIDWDKVKGDRVDLYFVEVDEGKHPYIDLKNPKKLIPYLKARYVFFGTHGLFDDNRDDMIVFGKYKVKGPRPTWDPRGGVFSNLRAIIPYHLRRLLGEDKTVLEIEMPAQDKPFEQWEVDPCSFEL